MLLSIKNQVSRYWSNLFLPTNQRDMLLELSERSDDIFICSYERSGTTWMQMILFQLLTDGDISSVKHIEQFAPNIQNYNRFELWMSELKKTTRVFKHHGGLKKFSKGRAGKYIYVMRNGMDVCVSQYYHHKAYGKIDLEESLDNFFERFLNRKFFNWFKHVKGWHLNKQELDVLVVKYEDLTTNLEDVFRKIISFCNIQISEQNIERALKRSQFQYMKMHQNKFGMRPGRKISKRVVKFDQFIRKGKTGEGRKTLTKQQKLKYATYFDKHLTGFGLEDYTFEKD